MKREGVLARVYLVFFLASALRQRQIFQVC